MPIARSGRPPAEVVGHPIALIDRVGAEAHRRIAHHLAARGVGLSLYAILTWLDRHGPRCQRELGEALGLDPGDLVRLLDQLEHRDLVRRDPDLDDRRRHRITLTRAGRSERRRCHQAVVAAEDEWLGALSGAEREALTTVLVRLTGGPASRVTRRRADRPSGSERETAAASA